MSKNVLELFHPLIQTWFKNEIGIPTDIQKQAWSKIAAGEHILATAPTGSGKTLTAFLWAINQFITGQWSCGQTRVIYISPMKALNNDIQKNLLRPLNQLKDLFEKEGAPFPSINVLTRSGDTSQRDRRTMFRKPPEILIITPESLNILLTSKNNRLMLTGIETVILDEIHSVAESKRGTHLITAVDRLILLCGEFQRIALSATVRPLLVIADFIGGYSMAGSTSELVYKKRPVSIIESGGLSIILKSLFLIHFRPQLINYCTDRYF
ncbi:MAG: DEAD/DEAH box helicase [Spirochaetes bacterium]|nr:DEAD/DEAH box helicase [Spirochaetota bacterium]